MRESRLTVERRESFDPEYLRAPFNHGFRQGRAGYPWRRSHSMRDAAPRSAQVTLAR
jgi:hypothetical protein